MAERELNIPIPGTDLEVKGLYREVAGAPLVVSVHGITGHKNEHLHYNGARAFENAGFSSYRFDLYNGADDARKLVDCTVETHATDLDVVLKFLRDAEPERKITVIGHSLGAVTILASLDRNFDNVILWDPSNCTRANFAERADYRWEASIGCWVNLDAMDILVGAGMPDSWAAVEFERIGELGVPTKIISAGNEKALVEGAQTYFDLAAEPKEWVVVDGADHVFCNGETAQDLFRETISWIERHGR